MDLWTCEDGPVDYNGIDDSPRLSTSRHAYMCVHFRTYSPELVHAHERTCAHATTSRRTELRSDMVMHMSIHMSIHMSMHMHVHAHVCLCTCPCICRCTCTSMYMSMYKHRRKTTAWNRRIEHSLSTHISAHMSIHTSIHMSIRMSTHTQAQEEAEEELEESAHERSLLILCKCPESCWHALYAWWRVTAFAATLVSIVLSIVRPTCICMGVDRPLARLSRAILMLHGCRAAWRRTVCCCHTPSRVVLHHVVLRCVSLRCVAGMTANAFQVLML